MPRDDDAAQAPGPDTRRFDSRVFGVGRYGSQAVEWLLKLAAPGTR